MRIVITAAKPGQLPYAESSNSFFFLFCLHGVTVEVSVLRCPSRKRNENGWFARSPLKISFECEYQNPDYLYFLVARLQDLRLLLSAKLFLID